MKNFFVGYFLIFFLLTQAFAMPKEEEGPSGASVARTRERRLPERTEIAIAQSPVPRPLEESIQIPEIARGYEDVYRRFVRGTLTYKPRPRSDEGRIDLPIRALVNPLEGEFDLSRCGNRGKYLSLNTGYRKGVRPENAQKYEVWIVPHFVVKKNLRKWLLFPGPAAHLSLAMADWNPSKAPVGLFYSWGGGHDIRDYEYMTSNSLNELSDNNLYEKLTKARGNSGFLPPQAVALWDKMEVFYLSFGD